MILTLEGFTLSRGYIVKELTILFDNGDHQHFHFKSPPDFQPTAGELRTIKFATAYLHQLPFHDQNPLPSTMIDTILKNAEPQTIIVAGHAAYNFVTDKLPCSRVIDICKKYGFSYPKELPETHCFKRHRFRYCALAKAQHIKRFMQVNCIEM